mmetsp:Transcript_5187/g.11460  ORF Transcript_5187/g.11460 Transcript_5187/m.11460 type:complete len:277 (+) Transcript_5187:48-878(+)
MFDVSFGEVAVITGVGIVLIGRKDLPIAANTLGKQVGRIVGLLQGARMRADRFATDHQLKQLQNEFRSGLRELDAVKAEMAGAMLSSRGGGIGGGLGAMVPGVNRQKTSLMGAAAGVASSASAGLEGDSPPSLSSQQFTPASQQSMGAEYLAAAEQAESSQSSPPLASNVEGSTNLNYNLAPRSQSVAAVAEEEWEKQGIGFRSIAERGKVGNMPESDTGSFGTTGVGGATILSNFIRQSLIYDQYERTVREQDDALRSRVEKVRKEQYSSDENKP